MESTILIVEDSRVFAHVLESAVTTNTPFATRIIPSLGKLGIDLAADHPEYILALVDYTLPDAVNGEAIDYVLAERIPVIVFTSHFSEKVRHALWEKGIIDYILKEEPDVIPYILSLIQRLSGNHDIKVLVADDSRTFRDHIRRMLLNHRFQVECTADGNQALQILLSDPEIRLLISDYHMPGLNGLELTREVRKHYNNRELAIIGISDHTDGTLPARFLKSGANDYLHKPFVHEEFYCRIQQNLEIQEYVQKIRRLAETDHLTGLYNRQYLFAHSQRRRATEEAAPPVLALLDIDHFKRINDTWGHPAGDAVLRHLAELLRECGGPHNIAARIGGEEFVLTGEEWPTDVHTHFESLCRRVEGTPVHTGEATIFYTISIGVCRLPGDSLEERLKAADRLLYRAKAEGRNRVCAELE